MDLIFLNEIRAKAGTQSEAIIQILEDQAIFSIDNLQGLSNSDLTAAGLKLGHVGILRTIEKNHLHEAASTSANSSLSSSLSTNLSANLSTSSWQLEHNQTVDAPSTSVETLKYNGPVSLTNLLGQDFVSKVQSSAYEYATIREDIEYVTQKVTKDLMCHSADKVHPTKIQKEFAAISISQLLPRLGKKVKVFKFYFSTCI